MNRYEQVKDTYVKNVYSIIQNNLSTKLNFKYIYIDIKSFTNGLFIYYFAYEGFLNNKIMKGNFFKEIEKMDIIEIKIAKDYIIPS